MQDPLTPRLERQSTALAALLMAGFTALLFADGIATGARTFYTPFDGIEQSYGYYQKLARALHRGYLPLWDANTLGGRSFAGEIITGVFYPPNIAASLIFGSRAGVGMPPLELIVVAHYWLAAMGMFALMRWWGVSMSGSLLAGLVFAFAGCVGPRASAQPQVFLGLTWIPVGMLFLAQAVDTGRSISWAGAGAVVGLQILSGHVQPAFHAVILYAFYAGWRVGARGGAATAAVRRLAGGIGVSVGAMLLVALPQLWLSREYFANAYRWVSTENPIGPADKVPFEVFAFKYAIEPQDVLNLVDPYKFPIADQNDLFIGIVPLAVVIAFAASPHLRRRVPAYRQLRGFLLSVLVFGVLSVLGHYSFLSQVLHAVPFVSHVRELGRYVILIHFVLAALVGLALDAALHSRAGLMSWGRRAAIVAAALLSAEALYLGTVHAAGLSMPTIAGLGWLAVTLILLSVGAPPRLIVACCLLGAATCTAFNRSRLMPSLPPASQGPAVFAGNAIVDYLAPYYGRYRVIVDDSSMLPKNYGHAHDVQTKMGHGATMWRPYFDFISQDWSLDSRVNDLLNVRWVISKAPLPLPLVLEDSVTGLKLFERARYYPRVYFRSQLEADPRSLVSAAYADLLDYRDHYQRYRLRTGQVEDVIFSEVSYPGWHALVDGVPMPITTAEIAGTKPLFRSVRVPAGEHIVEFRYLF
jgi:hypothetical protein